MEDRMRTGELEPEKMYGFANGEPDMTGVPAALADRVRKKPGRKPKAEIAAAEAEKATGHEKETARDIDKAMEKPLMTAKTLEEMRGKRARNTGVHEGIDTRSDGRGFQTRISVGGN